MVSLVGGWKTEEGAISESRDTPDGEGEGEGERGGGKVTVCVC